jgi:ESS family glutamate:Na+ symporter
MQQIKLDSWQTVMVAILVLFLGRALNRKFSFLNRYNIPEPVSSGVIVSGLITLYFAATGTVVSFDLFLRDVLLVVFFTCVGLSSSVAELFKGGRSLIILLLLSTLLIFVQNGIGVSLAKMLGIDQNIGLLGGSISLVGGLGTSIAWGKTLLTDHGTVNAVEIGVACATIGLVTGGFIGGPVSAYLIRKNKLEPEGDHSFHVEVSHGTEKPISEDSFMYTVLIVGIAVAMGAFLNGLLKETAFRLPAYVTSMFSGILLSNTIPYFWKSLDWPTRHASLGFIEEISLALFLAMSLMSLQLWNLLSMAAPIMLILVVQVLVIILFTIFVVFRSLKSSYNSAVISAGFIGFTLGATPTAMANMSAVTNRFGPAPYAFIIVPLVGGFLIDLINALVIELFLVWGA